jgi:hypothetical protein
VDGTSQNGKRRKKRKMSKTEEELLKIFYLEKGCYNDDEVRLKYEVRE